jgi:hypothetical protein
MGAKRIFFDWTHVGGGSVKHFHRPSARPWVALIKACASSKFGPEIP